MSTLYLIRHGQASFFGDDYDVLSELGGEQSRLLGAHLSATGVKLDAVYIGPRKRHQQTFEHMQRGAGGGLPEPELHAGFDEFPFEEMAKTVLPRLLAEDAELRALMPARGEINGEAFRRMNQFLEIVTARWTSGALTHDGIESYETFRDRVEAAVREVIEVQGRGKNVAVITSGGPVGMAMRWLLSMPDAASWKTAFGVRNTSLTELLYRDDEVTLVSYNATPHLVRREHITIR